MDQTQGHLACKKTHSPSPRQFSQCHAAHDKCQSLGAPDASLTGDNGQKYGEGHDPGNSGLESTDDQGGEKGGAEIDIQSWEPVYNRGADGSGYPFAGYACHLVHVLSRFFLRDVHQVFAKNHSQ